VLRAVDLPLWLLIASNVLGRAFISFFTHFLMHHIPLFWRVHRVHHSDTELDVSTTVRFHPLEFLIGLIPGLPLVHAFGLSPAVLIAYELGDAAVTLFSHANLRLPPRVERWLGYLIVTPGLHRIHHSARPDEADSNFGAVLPVWDLVFGTYQRGTHEPQSTMRLGLAAVRDERTTRLGWILSLPLKRLPSGRVPDDDTRQASVPSTDGTPDRTR
jgi:sterol desaturase/sphingolipid hydroxylase (fatty acid hydroxylase superfamily)